MRTLQKTTVSFLLSLICVTTLLAQGKPTIGKWVSIFNGKNLDGWEVKIAGYKLNDNFGNTFRVENGIMKVSYDQYDTFKDRYGHIFYHQPFSHYRLRVEYRFVGDQVAGGQGWALRNSGVMIHCQSPESIEKDQDYPISLECQLLGGTDSGDRPTANLCTPGTEAMMDGKQIPGHCINSSSKTYNGDQWVTVEVEVHGNELIKHMVNGNTVLVYEHPTIGGGVVNGYDPKVKKDGTPLKEGYISLQSESHPIEFRKVEIMLLDE